MKCPKCKSDDLKVLDTRSVDTNTKRRRQCNSCGFRFSTIETLEETPIYVIKKDRGRVLFDRNKLLRGLNTASVKRDITIEKLEEIVSEIEKKIQNMPSREISSKEIGDMVMEELIKLDQVAYVRFASVYKEFNDIKSFIEIVEDIDKKASKQTEKWVMK